MENSESIKYSDIKTSDSDFTFTGKLSELTINDNWTDGYKYLIGKKDKSNEYTSLWNALSAGTEESGNALYKSIRNYIDDIGNIDTCNYQSLKNYAKIFGITNEYINSNIYFPLEIENLINIFSVNRAYLYNTGTDGSEDTLVLSNSILHYSTVEQFIDSFKNEESYKNLINNAFYNTILEFINLKTVTFDDSKNGNTPTEIWKTDTSRFTNKLWQDDITSNSDIYKLKETLGVSKSFTEKIYVDDIIAGKRKITDFDDAEQKVLNAEIENRKNTYTGNSMKYYFMRLLKVLEYFRFTTIAYKNVYELEHYDLDENKYNIITDNDEEIQILKYNYTSYEIDTTIIRKVSEWLTEFSLSILELRNTLKSQCQKNMMTGTKRLIVDLIKKFVLDKIDSDNWSNSHSSIFKNANLSKNFDVSIVEYTDPTEYYNIENDNDSVKPSDYNLNDRYWNRYNDSESAFTKDEVLKFYNKLIGNSSSFTYNKKDDKRNSTNLYEFLSILFKSGATSVVNTDYYLSSELYTANNGTILSSDGGYSLTDKERDVIEKFTGDVNIGSSPYANYKNIFHPSYQLHPFIQAYEEYNDVYTSVMNLVNSFSENITDSIEKLKKRLDSLGNTINFWYNWNEDFSGYSSSYEKTNNDTNNNLTLDSPFNFKALNEFLNYTGEYINNILNVVNEYYIDKKTGKSILSTDETRLEIARLQKYYDKIKALANKEIYKYGKDYNGNVYILYKDKGCRNTLNALGEIWVRYKDHPIAFPLFDISLSPVSFNDTSCISETDNNKLINVLTTILKYFDSTYGTHINDSSVDDGKVILSNIGLTFGTYTEDALVRTNSDGTSAKPDFSTDYSNYTLSSSSMKLVYTSNSILNSYLYRCSLRNIYDVSGSDFSESYYFVDSVTNEEIPGGNSSVYTIYASYDDGSADEEVDNSTGKMLLTPDSERYCALYDYKESTFEVYSNDYNSTGIEENGEYIFADYDDENNYESGITYYCINEVTGKKHACTKRKQTIRKIYKLDFDALSGTVQNGGNVYFEGRTIKTDESSKETVFSSYNINQTDNTKTAVFDGGTVYEDFRKYTYSVNGEIVSSDSIVMVGGSNPYYLNTYSDSNGKTVINLEKAEIVDKGVVITDVYKFSDDIYRNNYGNTRTLSSFPSSGCVFKKFESTLYTDDIGQFATVAEPYKYYYPYTEIDDDGTLYDNEISDSIPHGRVVVHVDDTTRTYYYKLKSYTSSTVDCEVFVKGFDYNDYTYTYNTTSTKLNGNIELQPTDSVEYPITLDFNSESSENIGIYTSYFATRNQNKFYDIGFSYNQKMIYLSYENSGNDYINSGTIIGSISEKRDINYNKNLVFYRDSIHNIEYVDANSSYANIDTDIYDKFHVGDITLKSGIATVFCKYEKNNNIIEFSINVFNEQNVYSSKFTINLKYGLYEFDDGSKYSIKLSCTNYKLFISMTCKTPEDGEYISNSINGISAGSVGSAEFSSISGYCGDCIITVLPFDISEIENIYFDENNIKYIMSSGDIGYFSQYSGFVGKNNIFSNSNLSADTVFYIDLKYDEKDDEEIKFYNTVTAKIQDFDDDKSLRNFGKFVNIYSDNVNDSNTDINGVIISENNEYAYFVETSENIDGTAIRFTNFGNDKIYDISRGTESKVKILADGDNTENKVGVICETTNAENYETVGDKKKVKMNVYSSKDGYSRYDFKIFDDGTDPFESSSEIVTSENIYSLHNDGYTVSKLHIDRYEDKYYPMCGISDITEDAVQITFNDVKPVAGSKTEIKDEGYEYYSTKTGEKYSCAVNEDYVLFFNAYNKDIIQVTKSMKIFESMDYTPIGFFYDDSPYVVYCTNIVHNGKETDAAVYSIDKIYISNDTYVCSKFKYTITLAYNEIITRICNTSYDNIKLFSTNLGRIYKIDMDAEYSSEFQEITHTYDDLDEDIMDNIDYTVLSETVNFIMVSYNTYDSSYNGVMRLRKNTANTTGENIKFYNGDTECSHGKITKFLAVGSIVLAEENNGDNIYMSTDEGETFYLMSDSKYQGMTLAGCGYKSFYAYYQNGEKVFSDDGINWKNENNIFLSKWNVINANERTYITCSEKDSDYEDGIIDTVQYVHVTNQTKLSGEYEFDGIIENENGDIICYSGTDGSHSFRIARTFNSDDYFDFEYFDFDYSKGFSYNGAIMVGESLLFAPNGGMNVLKIENAFSKNTTPTVKYIDISNCVNNEVNIFKGFEYIDGNVVMFPSDGDRILVYNDNMSRFFNCYTFIDTEEFADCDSVNQNNVSEAILSPYESDSYGNITFMVTNFAHRNDYGIIEIDDGYPIMITYSKMKTKFSANDTTEYEVNSIKFKFINDVNERSTTIISIPEGCSKDIYSSHISSSMAYTVNGKTIIYSFTSMSSGLKIRIQKSAFNNSSSTVNDDYLLIEYSFDNETDRNESTLLYEGTGSIDVYDKFKDSSYEEQLS